MNTSCAFCLFGIAESASVVVLVLVTIALSIAAARKKHAPRSDHTPREQPQRKQEIRLIVPR